MSNKDYWQKTQINTCQNKEGLCLLIPWLSEFRSCTLSSFWFSLNDSLWDQRTFWSKGWQWHYSDVTHGCYTTYKDVCFNFTDAAFDFAMLRLSISPTSHFSSICKGGGNSGMFRFFLLHMNCKLKRSWGQGCRLKSNNLID